VIFDVVRELHRRDHRWPDSDERTLARAGERGRAAPRRADRCRPA
jgi:hypothetical protein